MDQAGALENSQSPMIAKGWAVMPNHIDAMYGASLFRPRVTTSSAPPRYDQCRRHAGRPRRWRVSLISRNTLVPTADGPILRPRSKLRPPLNPAGFSMTVINLKSTTTAEGMQLLIGTWVAYATKGPHDDGD